MPERFVQIVITKCEDGQFRIVLQDECKVIKSFNMQDDEDTTLYIGDYMRSLDIPSQAKRFEQA